MLNWIGRQYRAWRHTKAAAAAGAPAGAGTFALRRWESAETNRLNRDQWQRARGQSINTDLLADLEQLRTRASYELANNPTLEGVVNTYCDDVAGAAGPTLQVQCADDDYADALEAVWCDWFREPDATGRLGGVDLLSLWARGLWVNGEFLTQKVTAAGPPEEVGPVALRLKAIHPRRLQTPAEYGGDADVCMGVRLAPDGRPTLYYVSDPLRMGAFVLDVGKYAPLRPRDVVHRYLVVEEDQVRGVPWLATPLQSVADLRSYDAQVLDAARQAADMAVYWYTDHPDAPFLDVNESAEIERRTQTTGPPGWKPASFTPPQPATSYVDYRAERHREMGRPRGMPLMRVRLDSSKHSYSSARFDDQVYRTGMARMQGWFERRTLNGLLDDVRLEAELYAAAHPEWEHAAALRRPPRGGVAYRWIWPKFPHVDVQKEASGERIRLEDGTLTYGDALAAYGLDEDTVIASRKRTDAKLRAAGLPPLPSATQSGPDLAAAIDAREQQEKQDEAEDAAPDDQAEDTDDATDPHTAPTNPR